MDKVARILVFDSGVGGLSILKEIQHQHPYCSLFYASDNAAFPYGTKNDDELIKRIDHVLHKLQQEVHADIIVMACNTASTLVLPRIRQRFSQPIIGVVPAIKPAAKKSISKVIGLLATRATVDRQYTQSLIEQFASDCHIIRVGSTELVELAEKKLRGDIILPEQLEPILAPFRRYQHLDTIVLACTHFPLLKKELQQTLPDIKFWVDSGEAIGRRVGYWLDELQLLPHSPKNNSNLAYFTHQEGNIDNLQTSLENFSLQKIKYL